MKKCFQLILAFSISLPLILPVSVCSKNILRKRYIYYQGDAGWGSGAIDILNRAKNSGYNGIVCVISPWDKNSSNFAQFESEANKAGVPLIPAAFYQNEASVRNVNLSEAFPVKDSKFLVGTNGYAAAVAKELIANPGFETYTGKAPANWKVPSGFCTIDAAIKHSGNVSVLIQNSQGETKIQTGFAAQSFKAYKLSVWIKTENFSSTRGPFLSVTGGGRPLFWLKNNVMPGLSWGGNGISGTQNWTQYVCDFNAFEYTGTATATLQITDGQAPGKIWVDDFSVEEVGLYETIRRPSCPVVVKSNDGLKTFSENQDYNLEIPAPRMGLFPDIQNDQGKIKFPGGSNIKAGDTIKVSWYQWANNFDWFAFAAASSCSEAWSDTIKTRIREISNGVFSSPSGLMMGYDEWWQVFWDPACQQSPYNYKTAGEYMGGTIRSTEQLIRQANPQMVDVYVWNDMVDPTNYAGAKPPMMGINGSLSGGWYYVTPSICIMNWSFDLKSFLFWGGKNAQYPIPEHRQIMSGFYGGPSTGLVAILDSLDAKGVNNVVGYMYTCWDGDYSQIENEANLFKSAGRWGSNASPFDASDIAAIKDTIVVKPGVAPVPQTISLNNDLTVLNTALSGSRTIHYGLDQNQNVVLRVMSVTGQVLETLLDAEQRAGSHRLNWNTKKYTEGIYFLTLKFSGKNRTFQRTQKIIVF